MFKDKVSTELDRRKLQKLVDDGIITSAEIADAPIIEYTPDCGCNTGLEDLGGALRCPLCRVEGKPVNKKKGK